MSYNSAPLTLQALNTPISTTKAHQHSAFTVLLLLALLGLSACSTLPTEPKPLQPTTSALQQWQLRGKIGIRNGKQANSAYLNWRQCGEQFDIRLTGPLGRTAAHLYGNEQQATLQTSDQQLQAKTPEQLLKQHLGWTLPVSHLVYWLQGLPAPQQSYQANTDGSGFMQHGWQLSFPRYTDINGHQLPTKAIAQQPPLKVTLLIKQWQLNAQCEPSS